MTPEIKPCPFCGGRAVFHREDQTVLIGCTDCGAQGNRYHVAAYQDQAKVEHRAISVWNTRTPPAERNPRTPSDSTGANKSGPVSGPNGPGIHFSNGRDLTHQEAVRVRLQSWLEAGPTTIETAIRRDKIDLGASTATLYNLINGQPLWSKTVAKIERALDQLERQPVRKAAEDPPPAELPQGKPAPDPVPVAPPVVVEKLGNKFRQDTGLHPLPKLKPPPRCARTP